MGELSTILSELPSLRTNRKSAKWFVRWIQWVIDPAEPVTTRLREHLEMLDENPLLKEAFVAKVSELLIAVVRTAPFSSLGLSSSRGFFDELLGRIQERFLPSPPLEDDLTLLVQTAFGTEANILSLDDISESLLGQFLALFSGQTELQQTMLSEMSAAMVVLGSHVLSESLLLRHQTGKSGYELSQLPEYLLAKKLDGFYDSGRNLSYLEGFDSLKVQIEAWLHDAVLRMHDTGISVELVHRIDSQKRRLGRLDVLTGIFLQSRSFELSVRLLLVRLAIDVHHQGSLREFLVQNLSLLTKRIVQANSHIGEHYVTFNWTEFRKMFQSAIGGGGITAFTVYAKFFLAKLGLVGFLKGFVEALNYSTSFLAIQVLGFTLATKQPSATAPFLASAIQKSKSDAQASIIALLRTQFIAVLGNLAAVFPISFALAWIFLLVEQPLFSPQEVSTIQSSTDFLGPSMIYAAFTGALLFSASLIAGWFENWFLLRRIRSRLLNSAVLNSFLSEVRLRKFADFLAKNSNAVAANISLGFILGLAPQFLKFFGLPLDVRHVTLAMGAFAASLPQAVAMGLTVSQVVNSLAGIFVIGILNISVSFSLAFILACASSRIRVAEFAGLIWGGIKMVLLKPWLLLVPED